MCFGDASEFALSVSAPNAASNMKTAQLPEKLVFVEKVDVRNPLLFFQKGCCVKLFQLGVNV